MSTSTSKNRTRYTVMWRTHNEEGHKYTKYAALLLIRYMLQRSCWCLLHIESFLPPSSTSITPTAAVSVPILQSSRDTSLGRHKTTIQTDSLHCLVCSKQSRQSTLACHRTGKETRHRKESKNTYRYMPIGGKKQHTETACARRSSGVYIWRGVNQMNELMTWDVNMYVRSVECILALFVRQLVQPLCTLALNN